MRAIRQKTLGDPEVLKVVTMPRPVPQAIEVGWCEFTRQA
jgi:NADPH:quinone reductase-like Zn-dependent oxidoreductase